MSYILDALKRADAERERGHVPGLHAQPPAGAPAARAAKGAPRWAWAAAGGVGLVVVAALAWRLGADAHAPLPGVTPETGPTPDAAPTAPMAMPAPPVTPPAEPVALAPVPVPVPAPTPRPMAAPPAQPPAAVGPVPAPAKAPTPASPASPPPAAAPLPLYAQLPAALRQQLPALAVTGSVYSDDAASRFIMLNGDIAKEGSQPAPGLVVERIEPRSAVLRYQGERFRLPY